MTRTTGGASRLAARHPRTAPRQCGAPNRHRHRQPPRTAQLMRHIDPARSRAATPATVSGLSAAPWPAPISTIGKAMPVR